MSASVNLGLVGFKFLTAVGTKVAVCWLVALCSLVKVY
jgi:hypothetical protein